MRIYFEEGWILIVFEDEKKTMVSARKDKENVLEVSVSTIFKNLKKDEKEED